MMTTVCTLTQWDAWFNIKQPHDKSYLDKTLQKHLSIALFLLQVSFLFRKYTIHLKLDDHISGCGGIHKQQQQAQHMTTGLFIRIQPEYLSYLKTL